MNYEIMTRLKLSACLGIIFLCAFCLPTFAASEFKIITLQHRLADEILPTIQALVGENGTASAMQNNLIIRATPNEMAAIEEVITRLDSPRQNLTITISRESVTNTNRNNITINGRKLNKALEIATGEANKRNTNGADIAIEQQQYRHSANSQQFIQVLDGAEAFIRVGQRIPYTQQWLALTQQYARIQTSTQFVDIDTGFSVRPRSIGNQVELSIAPKFSQLNRAGVIEFESLSTVIRVNRGEWVDIGGMMQQNDDVSRAILNRQSENTLKNEQLFIIVE